MIEKTIIILYYLFIIKLLSSIENINKNIFIYIYFLIALYIYSIICNISYSENITNMIMFSDMVLSLIIIRELNLNKQHDTKNNINRTYLYYICIINITIYIYNNVISDYNSTNIINTI